MSRDTFEEPWAGAGKAGTPALDFANTLDWRLRREPEEKLASYEDLLRWARAEGTLEPEEAGRLRSWATARPGEAARVLADAVGIREAIAEAVSAAACGRPLPPDAVAVLDAAVRRASEARRLRASGAGVAWEWDSLEPDRPALAAALDAVRLLVGADRGRIRQCADDECGWFFLDASRNRSRRWCSMESCGNRNKARRHYRRRRAASGAGDPGVSPSAG